jgi:hypothetical protein
MKRTFSGTLAGNGLNLADVAVEMDSEAQPDGSLLWRGGFVWNDASHTFAVGEQYRFDLEYPRFYDIRIAEVTPPTIKFET